MTTPDGREVVLVTGFPRSLAKYTVEAIMARHPGVIVRMLVRTKFRADAEAFITTLADPERITLLEGDCAAIDLGLSGREFLALAHEVDVIQHLAQITYEAADPRVVEALNVQGTREVLELARSARALTRLVHLSSAGVSGDRRGLVREDELEAGQGFHSSVDETRFRAERFVRNASASIPTTILRPSVIVGHSRTGDIDRLDGPYLLVQLLLASPADMPVPLPMRGSGALNMVPVDYVAEAAAVVMNDARAVGRTLHLVDPSPPTAREAFERIAKSAGRTVATGLIPMRLTRAVLKAPGLDRLAQSPRAFLERAATPVQYASQHARELLGPYGVRCPPFDQYAESLVELVRRRQVESRARTGTVVAEEDDPLA